jgi:hypothetical protein
MTGCQSGLKRYQQTGDLHFITFSCYQRLPFLATPHAKQIFDKFLRPFANEFEVADMPVTVAVDAKGTSVHQTSPAEWQARIAQSLPHTAILQ